MHQARYMHKKSMLFGVLILLVFCIIIWACGLVGNVFGPLGENIALGIIAVILFIGFTKAKREAKKEEDKNNNIDIDSDIDSGKEDNDKEN